MSKLSLLNSFGWISLWLMSLWNSYVWLKNSGDSLDWLKIISWSGPYYLSMPLISPIIYYLYHRYSHKTLRFQWTLHAALAVLLGFAHQLLINVSMTYYELPASSLNELVSTRQAQGYIFSTGGFLFYWLVIGTLIGLYYYNESMKQRDRTKALSLELQRAQIDVLRMQIQPHFLFNTFNHLSMMARNKQSTRVVEMLANLSDLLRMTLAINVGNKVISLNQEIAMIKKYLEIIQSRFSDRLAIDFNIDSQTETCMVPGFLLQPIVENAVKHGIEKHSGLSRIIISTSRRKDQIILTVFNSGSSLEEGWNIQQGKGTGLDNTMKRLNSLPIPGSIVLTNKGDGVECQLTLNCSRSND